MIKPKWNSKSVGEYERSLKPKVEDDDDIQEYKKPWVGLTDDEVREIYGIDLDYKDGDYARYARAIEAKLKEKNT